MLHVDNGDNTKGLATIIILYLHVVYSLLTHELCINNHAYPSHIAVRQKAWLDENHEHVRKYLSDTMF